VTTPATVGAPQRDQAGAGRTFRLFVSSTFSDLQEERNALHREVFPKLRDLCTQHGARFQVIDLRWGVSTEAGLDQKTMPLCLGEIERCQRSAKPNFLVLLGDRYGWRPLPAEIPTAEFDRIVAQVPDQLPEPHYQPDPEGTRSATYGRWHRSPEELLREWYLPDDNAVPPAHFLQPRAKDGGYGLTDAGADTEDWKRVEHYLGLVLRGAVDELQLPDEDKVKYLASATEQEIRAGALAVDDAADHVYCFFRTITGLPHDATSTQYEDIVDGELDDDAGTRLARLKGRLADWVPGNVETYQADWVTAAKTPTTDHIQRLCTEVREHLAAVIRRRFAEGADMTALEIEDAAHRRFADERAAVFVGRQQPRAAIASYLANPSGHLLVVHGKSGSGKSALMARAALDAAPSDRHQVLRFVGATAGSSEGRALIANLCRQIGVRYADESEVPADFRDLVLAFPKRLQHASADRPLTIFLDAVDQLGTADPARTLTWLPAQLPDHVALVVSTLPGDTLDALRVKPGAELVEVSAMPDHDAAQLLDTWLAAAQPQRHLQPSQKELILNSFQNEGLPLYLKLAFEEARQWRSTDTPDLGADIPGVIRDNLFDRLDDPENHGEALVSRALGYLAASRYGLAEDELLSVLSTDVAVSDWLTAETSRTRQALPEGSEGGQRIPVVLWARLYADLEPYLTERATEGATVLTFYHRQFGDVAREAFLGNGTGQKLHTNLARYFRSRIDPDEDGTWAGSDLRGLSELPYHLIESEDWNAVEKLLTDFRFMERKVAEVGIVEQTDAHGNPTQLYTGVYQLLDDYDHALRKMGGQGDDRRRRIVVTAVDLGNGLEIRCPHCNRMIPWKEEYRGDEHFTCPLANPDCGGPLKVNRFVVGEQM
jgi:hypothetical protein